jgi:hypothetical protein
MAAAALVAMREVETAVRERVGFPDTVVGAGLINTHLVLTDPWLTYQLRKLSAKACVLSSKARSASSKIQRVIVRSTTGDPVQAAEIVLLADVLLRMLDATEVERPGPIPGPN